MCILMAGPSGVTVPPLFIAMSFVASTKPSATRLLPSSYGATIVAPVRLDSSGASDDVVRMTVRDQDQVDLAERGEVLVLRRRSRILLEKGIDDDHLARGARDAERGMARATEPRSAAPAARPAYAQSTTATAAIALTLLLAKMDMTPPSGLACDGTTLLPCLAQPHTATPIDDSISLTPARVLAGLEVCEGAA